MTQIPYARKSVQKYPRNVFTTSSSMSLSLFTLHSLEVVHVGCADGSSYHAEVIDLGHLATLLRSKAGLLNNSDFESLSNNLCHP